MFDIGFWELAIIGIVALLVIGPERMPEMVRTIGQWAGQFQRLIATLKREIEAETRSDEYKLLNKEFLNEDKKFKAMVRQATHDESVFPDGEKKTRGSVQHSKERED
tara:strand:- start:7 stop:327 length:321 start_codon:yes stop_codon:yes gene_type:complete